MYYEYVRIKVRLNS